MTTFDEGKAYKPQEDIFFDDGREVQLLHFVYSHPKLDEIRGSPEGVLAAIDEYGRTKKYLMNVGEDKGKIVSELIAKTKPKLMVELGGYVGYSTILFGAALQRAGGQTYICLERNAEFAAVVSSLVNLAGLSSTVRVEVGSSGDSLKRLAQSGVLGRSSSGKGIDLLFLDHYKPAYLPDLKLCEELELVGPGSVLAADNVVKPGNPPYLEYVRASVADKKRWAGDDGTNKKNGVDQGFESRYSRQYEKREGVEELDGERRGDPALVYESELVKSFEPTGVPDGVEITKCVGRED